MYTESFRSNTAPGWEFEVGSSGTSPGPRLTAEAVPNAGDPEFGAPEIDVNGNGWLRLATTTGNQANAVALDTAIPAAGNNIRVSFDYSFWKPGTSPADGITVFLWDAGLEFEPGAFGGSLGYAQKTGIDGLAGAYVGVGLDVYGNFANNGEGRTGNITSLVPNSVVVRGSGTGTTGYNFLDGTVSGTSGTVSSTLPTLMGEPGFRMDFINSPTRPDQDAEDYRHFEMELDENDVLTVWMQSGYDGTLTQILQTTLPGARPDQLRIGFSGATGGSIEVYELRNLQVSTTGGTNSFYWDDENGNELWGTGENWDQNTVPSTYSHVVFSDAFPDTKVDQTVNINGGNRTISSATFSGDSSYTVSALSGQQIIFNTNGNGKSYLNVLNSPSGNADHTINANLRANNDLDVQNLVDQSLTLNGNININGNDITFETTGQTRANGVISGWGDVIVEGQGTTIFAGSNTYSGTTTVRSGRLQLEHANGLSGTGNNNYVQDGGSLALAANIVTASNENININGDGNVGTGALVNASGNNTFGAGVFLQSNSTIGAESGTMSISGQTNAGNNDLTVYTAAGSTVDFNGQINGSGMDLTKTGAGTAILSVRNTYSGETVVQEGTLRAENAESLGNNNGNTTVLSGATLELANTGTISAQEDITIAGMGVAGKAALWGASGTSELDGPLTLTGGTSSIGAASGAQLRIDQGIYGAGQNIVITGNGTTVYAAPEQSQSGSTTVQSGATLLFADAGNRINDSSAVVIESGATLDMANSGYSDTVGSLAGGGTLRTRGATMTAGGDNTSTTFSGSIQDNGNFTKQGTGNMTFTGSNTFTGDLNVNAGTVTVGANNTFHDNMDVNLNGGTLATNGFADTMNNFTLSSNSTIDFMGATGGFLTFDAMNRTGGALTIDGWSGNLNGNGNTRLQV
ncbi:MAG: autotransporter-associated beta strand repeat-containing protein, partial [Puniceicoccales bacterium]